MSLTTEKDDLLEKVRKSFLSVKVEAVDLGKQESRSAYRRKRRNRHSHSDEKPSFFALGFKSMKLFKQKVTEDEWRSYLGRHRQCCGCLNGVYLGQ